MTEILSDKSISGKANEFANTRIPPFCMYSGILRTLYIQNRRVLSKLQEKAFDKVMKIL